MIRLPQNINIATLAAAVAGIFAYLCPGIPSEVRWDILLVAFVVYTVAVPYLHNLVNHPANVAAAGKAWEAGWLNKAADLGAGLQSPSPIITPGGPKS